MGTFGIDSATNLVVEDCHINVWSLPGLGRREFLWDVGLRLSPTKEVRELNVLLPFGPDAETHPFDLSADLEHEEVSRLIFGRPVTRGQGQIDYGNGLLTLAPIDGAGARIDADHSGSWYSRWTIPFRTPLVTQHSYYVRFRFKIRHLGRFWRWKHYLLIRGGALVDIRFCDFRETTLVRDWKRYESDLAPIRNLYVFAIVPTRLVPSGVSPTPHYMRFLEGSDWNRYSRRKAGIANRAKLTILEWRRTTKDQTGSPHRGGESPVGVSTHKPLRILLDLRRERPLAPIVFTSLVTAILIGLLFDLILRGSRLLIALAAIVLAWVVNAAAALLNLLPLTSLIGRQVRRGFLWLDNVFYGAGT